MSDERSPADSMMEQLEVNRKARLQVAVNQEQERQDRALADEAAKESRKAAVENFTAVAGRFHRVKSSVAHREYMSAIEACNTSGVMPAERLFVTQRIVKEVAIEELKESVVAFSKNPCGFAEIQNLSSARQAAIALGATNEEIIKVMETLRGNHGV